MKNILLISSANPTQGPGTIAKSKYDLLKQNSVRYGFIVDMLTLFEQPKCPEIKYIYKTHNRINRFITFFRLLPHRIENRLYKQPNTGYCFFYRKEIHPPVNTSLVLKQIQKDYDIILIYFWQGLLSFKTINDLYDKYPSKFVFMCADYSPMSGGCHFTNDCERYVTGCGCCPAFNSENDNDFTRFNVEYRKRVYTKVKPIIWANKYMIDFFFKESYLLKDQQLVYYNSSLDTDFFRPIETGNLREKHKIPEKKTFVISFGCQSLTDERKGMSYMLEALNILYEMMTKEERSKTLVIAIGNDGQFFGQQIKFDFDCWGYIPVSELPEFYSISNVFVCSSVNDAGPSMLAQSLACGTPLVAFEMGSALEVLVGQKTGINVKLRDSRGLAEGILSLCRMPQEEYLRLRQHCRNYAESSLAKESFVKQLLSLLN